MMPMQWCQVVPSVLLALVLNVPRILEMTPVNRIQWNCSVNQYYFNFICVLSISLKWLLLHITMKLINKRRQLFFFPKLNRFAHANKIMRSTLKPHLKQLYIKGSIFSHSHHSLYQAQLNRAKLWDLGKHWPQIIGKNHLLNYLYSHFWCYFFKNVLYSWAWPGSVNCWCYIVKGIVHNFFIFGQISYFE